MKKKPTKKCPMVDECWEQIPVTRHFCNACSSWWHRIQTKSDSELAGYMRRMGRITARFGKLRAGRRAA